MGFFNRVFRGNTPQPAQTKEVTNPVTAYRSAFMAAAASRLTNGWYKPLLSSNKELLNDLPVVRGLARYLAKNDVYTARFLELVQTNIVGPSGVQFVPRVMGPNEEFNDPVNKELKRGWEEWSRVAGVDGYSNFTDIEQLAVRTLAMDGEVFVRIVTGPKVNKFGFGLMLIDADLLDVGYNLTGLKNGNSVVQGVEVNRFGVPEAFHFWSRHPNDLGTTVPLTRDRIPADEIIHLFKRNRVGQLRGYSWVAPAMYFLAKLHEYMDAEVVAAQAAASQVATIETPLNDVSGYQSNGSLGPEVLNLEPGVVVRLAPGEKLNPWTSNHPNNAFGPFVETILHGVASALNVSYSSLSSDASKENYAGGRIGQLTERDYWKNQQSWFIRQFHEKVYTLWVQYALGFNAVDLPNDPSEYSAVEFRPRGWKWADPLRDLKSAEGAINANLTSKADVCAEMGLDYKEVLEKRYEEIKLEAQYRRYLEEEGLGEYINQLTAPSPHINEATPTANDLMEEEEGQELVNAETESQQ